MPAVRTFIATSDESSITVRGRDLVHELLGRYTFSEMIYFLTCGRMPAAPQTKVLDACLVTLMEHGWTPIAMITRLTLDSVPDQPQVAMGAGLMAVGSVFAGTMEGCARILAAGVAQGGDLDAYCQRVVGDHRATKTTLPGLGHRMHKPDDPRSPRLFEIAREAGVDGRYIALLQRLNGIADKAYGRHLTINATGAIGALLLEIGIPLDAMRGMAVVSRAGGLLGHIVEERETHAAREMWRLTCENIPYEDPPA